MEAPSQIEEEISEYERERGKPMPSYAHARIQLNLILFTSAFHDYLSLPELNLDLDGNKSVPDIVVYEKKTFTPPKGAIWITTPPLIAIEILSPKQALQTLFDKAKIYVNHGVEEAWVIIPEIQSITVCKSMEKQKTYTTGDVHYASTGIIINIEQLFADIL